LHIKTGKTFQEEGAKIVNFLTFLGKVRKKRPRLLRVSHGQALEAVRPSQIHRLILLYPITSEDWAGFLITIKAHRRRKAQGAGCTAKTQQK
jgi:hypothetical protein